MYENRLLISDACPLILPYHVALDQAREQQKGAIGTTCRGIGPSYEDKVGRRCIRFGDLFYPELLRERLQDLHHYHTTVLENFFDDPVSFDFEDIYQGLLKHAD